MVSSNYVKYGASKTKITVVGSAVDRQYYSEISPWRLDDSTVEVSTDNEHLGQIVTGVDQVRKNVDLRISKGRNAIFSLRGPAFNNKCLLNPALKYHLIRTYISPIIRSGLSSFALKSSHLAPLNIFHRKILRGILNLSRSSSIPALHFSLCELPMEGQIHKDVFSLFFIVWSNPQSKIYAIIKYLLETSSPNSRTWAIHLRFTARKYGLLDPLSYLNMKAPTKESFKELINTKVSVFYENELRTMAAKNSCMTFFNVSLIGLRGRHHPALSNISTTHEVKKAQFHIKMLVGDYLTFEKKASQSGGAPICKSCEDIRNENIIHIVSQCKAYSEIGERIKLELCLKGRA